VKGKKKITTEDTENHREHREDRGRIQRCREGSGVFCLLVGGALACRGRVAREVED
jgi:hypothetical protein